MESIKGRYLEFISQINRNGQGTSPVDKEYLDILQDEIFSISGLSLSNKTFIAHGFNSFVVKMKPKDSSETLVSKLRNNLTPLYSLADMVLAMDGRRGDEIKKLMYKQAELAKNLQNDIKELLTQLENGNV